MTSGGSGRRRGGPRRGKPKGKPKGGGRARGRGRRGSGGVGGERIEGRHAVREALVAGTRPVREVVLADDLERSDLVADILELAKSSGVPVRRVPRRYLDAEARTEAPQGVMAVADPLPEAELDGLVATDRPFLLALDGVTDPGNLGALLRTADAAGVTGIVLPRHRAAHVTAAVTKAAAGAAEHVPIAVVPGMPAALQHLKEAGLWVVGLDEAGDRPLFGVDVVDGPVVVVLGAEGRGLGRLVRERCDVLVRIPLRGHLPSLNVSVAGALACFEVARRR